MLSNRVTYAYSLKDAIIGKIYKIFCCKKDQEIINKHRMYKRAWKMI